MPRQRTFKHNVFLRMSQIEHVLTSYYARKYDRDQTAVIRAMVRQYVRADTEFDVGEFKRYVEEHIRAEAAGDPDAEAEIRAQVEQFLEKVRQK
jgi:hypothetical protein